MARVNGSSRLHLRLTPDMAEELKALADAEHRPINNYIEYLVIKKMAKVEAAKLSSAAQLQDLQNDSSLRIAGKLYVLPEKRKDILKEREIEQLLEENFAGDPSTLKKIALGIFKAEKQVLKEYPQVEGNTKYIGEIAKLLSELKNIIRIDDMSEQDIEDYVYTKYKAMVEDDLGEQKR